MRKILVIYYTQSGQLREAIDATLSPLIQNSEIVVHYELIKPKVEFPFPWSYREFFNAFAQTVKGVPCALEPFSFNASENYDLVILAYQSWFLSVSIPMNSFLQTKDAELLLKDKKVVTLIACRNMWLNAQEKMKKHLQKLQAQLVGNITYVDQTSNLTSLVTVIGAVLFGKRKNFLGLFPKYGVSDKVLSTAAPRIGEIILKCTIQNNYDTLQENLILNGAINIKPNLLFMEGRGKIFFPKYADFILSGGDNGSKGRNIRVRILGIVLPLALFTLSPIITLFSRLIPLLMKKKYKKEVEYYSRNLSRE